jgi:hypothetical protein
MNDEEKSMTMQSPQTKSDMIELIRRSHNALVQAIKEVPDEQLTAAESGWSVKDIMAHITAWERVLLRSHIEGRPYEQAVEGGEPLPQLDNVDEINDWFYHQSAATPLEDVRMDFDSMYQRVLTAIQQMTEADLLRGQSRVRPEASMLEAIAGNTWEHYDEHAATIRQLSAAGSEPQR